MINFNVEWSGAPDEELGKLLEKTQSHSTPSGGGSLNAHLISIPKSASIKETILIWMNYPDLPDQVRLNPIFIFFLTVMSLALLSPRSIRLIPDPAGNILKLFKIKNYHQVVTLESVTEFLGDRNLALRGIEFLLAHRFIEQVDDGAYKLLIVPLTNLKITFINDD